MRHHIIAHRTGHKALSRIIELQAKTPEHVLEGLVGEYLDSDPSGTWVPGDFKAPEIGGVYARPLRSSKGGEKYVLTWVCDPSPVITLALVQEGC
jgi:hypothetical protein